jgi:hypothetical protein
MRRTFLDENLLEWEAYISGGQPGTDAAARIYFNCLTDRSRRPLFVPDQSGNVAAAQRTLGGMETADLIALLQQAVALP